MYRHDHTRCIYKRVQNGNRKGIQIGEQSDSAPAEEVPYKDQGTGDRKARQRNHPARKARSDGTTF